MDMTKYTVQEEQMEWLNTQTFMELGVSESKVHVKKVREQDFEDGVGEVVTKPVVELSLETNGQEYAWVLNKTNTQLLIERYGPNSLEWIGKAFKLRLERVNYRGTMTNGIRVAQE